MESQAEPVMNILTPTVHMYQTDIQVRCCTSSEAASLLFCSCLGHEQYQPKALMLCICANPEAEL